MRCGVITILFVLLFWIVFSPSTFAQTATSSAAPQTVSYDLPYPGLLPDNPLYIFKTLRDRIIGILITNPLKKAQFELLNSDKRVNASYFLFGKREYRLAVDTLSKSNNYLHDTLTQIQQANKQGYDTGELRNQLKSAIQKHLELAEGMEKTAKDPIKSGIIVEEKRLQEFQEDVKKL